MAPCIVISKLYACKWSVSFSSHFINPLNAKLNRICHFLALLGAHPILHVSRIRVNQYSSQHSSDRRLSGLQTSLEEPQHVHIGSSRNTWRFGNTAVSGTVSMGNLSLSALLARLKACHEALVCRASGLWLSLYFVGTSIFIRMSVPSCNTSSSEDISRARCTKRNQGQGPRIWNRSSGKKWQQFLPACCIEWCRTSRNAWGNVLTNDTTSQTLYSGSKCCN